MIRAFAPAIAVALGVASTIAAAPAPGYRVAGSIPGPDGAGWDYAAVDPMTHRLFVAHGDAVTKVDLTRRDAVSSIGDIVHGHAVVPLPGGQLLVASGRDDSVRILDQESGKELARIAVGNDPDAALYDAATGHAYVMNAHGGTISDIDITQRAVARTIPAKAGLEFAQLGRGHRLYVNNEDANEIEVVDLAAGRIATSIPLPGCDRPTGLAYDAPHDRLISACGNGRAAIVDVRVGRVAQTIAIGRGPDAVLIDPVRGFAMIPCGGDGELDILSLGTTVAKRQVLTTERGARTGALDPATGDIYLPTAAFDPPAKPGGRPVGRVGTFHLVVVRPA